MVDKFRPEFEAVIAAANEVPSAPLTEAGEEPIPVGAVA